MPHDSDEAHYALVTKAIAAGRVVPFLGAGASLCGRPPRAGFEPGKYLPSGTELTEYLSDSYPAGEPRDLLRVAQFVYVMEGSGPLYERLHNVFNADYPITALHSLLASIPATLQTKHYANPHLLVMTTNYDDLLERAFEAVGEPCDVVWYVADGDSRGKFRHRTPDGEIGVIDKPNEYSALSLKERSVILKIHGAVNRLNSEEDSFVIAEDHYIDYLTRTDIAGLIPITLAAKVKKSHFLFLGYSLADWNMRVILQRIWGGQQLTYKSWAIQSKPRELDIEFWKKRGVDILDVELNTYVAALQARLAALPVAKDGS
jgi:SIR2-like domain